MSLFKKKKDNAVEANPGTEVKRTPAQEEEHNKEIEEKRRILIHKEMLRFEESNRKKEKKAPEGVCISLQHVNKIYPNHVQAVYDFNLDIKDREFIVLVGPSGCGKSTTLRMIAGLEDVTAGDLYISGVYANDLEPKARDIAMVFQSYALYPHMTVYENIAFGLEMRHCKKDYIDQQVQMAAKNLGLSDYLDRKPGQLSGGQRQRVALGRAIVKNSKVFLMDEPLSNLDAKLRVQMRSQIVKLHRSLGCSTVYVTHDQTEAMTMATRIVVMKDGRVQQIGTPREIYSNPTNIFVATFIGSPGMNILDAIINKKEKTLRFPSGFEIELSEERIQTFVDFYKNRIEYLEKLNSALREKIEITKTDDPNEAALVKEVNEDSIAKNDELINKYKALVDEDVQEVKFGVRPEDIAQTGNSSLIKEGSPSYETHVTVSELLGNEYHVHCEIGGQEVVGKFSSNVEVDSDCVINILFNMEKIHVFDPLSTDRIF